MNSLQHWEERLKPFYNKGLRIIGEIPFTYADLESMAEAIGGFVRKNGRKSETTERLVRDYPLTFITLMSGFAAYNTEQNFWQAFADFVHVDIMFIQGQWWRSEFITIAKKLNLKVFDFEDAAHPYVTSIRYQGGIPMYSLPDYFGKMVLPAVQRPDLREVSPKEALKHLLEHSYFVDAPVLNFLENSGDFGVEFFAESCHLARHALEHNGEVLPLEEVNLPEYIVYGFDKFIETAFDPQQHWSRPYLQVAPYSEDTAVHLILPEQEISLELAASQLTWKISFPEGMDEQVIPCRMFRRRQSVVSGQVPVPIQKVVQRVEVSINAHYAETGEARELRRWSLPVLPGGNNPPVIVFDGDCIQTGSSRLIPAGILYFLLPSACDLKGQGLIQKVEDFGGLVGAWKGWKTESWDVSQALSVSLVVNDAQLGDSIPVQGVIARPELTGGHPFQYQQYPDQPLYTSGPPSIRIPLVKGAAVHPQLSNWQVHIRSLWESNPNINTLFNFNHYAAQVQLSEDRAELPLQSVLGKDPSGLYRITVSGPRSLKAQFQVRLWPKLIISGHSTQLRPPQETPEPYQVRLHLPDGASCEVQAGADPLEIENTFGVWQITAPPDLERVLLDLVLPAGGTSPVRVPVSIPLPTLQWALAAGNDLGSLKWSRQLLQKPIDQLSQAGSAALHFRMYGLSESIHSLRLRLVDINDERVILQEVKLKPTDFEKDWLRVSLGQFTDTIKTIHSIGQFELYLPPQANGTPEVVIPVMELTRALDIQDVGLEQIGDLTWKINWKEEHPLKNRRVMLVPAWQPWQKPWEYKVPNKVKGEFVLSNVSLPPTRYHVYFSIQPDWVPPQIQPPEGVLPHVVDFCTEVDRLQALQAEEASPNHNLAFKNLAEQACIYDAIGNKKERDLAISRCTPHLIHLTDLDLLTGFIHWMQGKDIDRTFKSFFLNQMFNPRIVREMFRRYSRNADSLATYLDYCGSVKLFPAESARWMLNNHVDHSTALSRSLNELLQKEDSELVAIVVEMMSEARLSRQDAVALLKVKSTWAIEKVADLPVNPYTNSLLAGMLAELNIGETAFTSSKLAAWMVRCLPDEENGEKVLEYFTFLFEHNTPGIVEMLVRYTCEGRISEGNAFKLLTMNPAESYKILQNSSNQEGCKPWLERLELMCPSAAGIIHPGSSLITPFGKVVVEYLKDEAGTTVDRIRLGAERCIIYGLSGAGKEQVKLVLDCIKQEASIPGVNKAWRCRTCGFIHPDNNVVTNHFRTKHQGSPALGQVTLPVFFDTDETKIDPQSQDTGA